MLTAEHDTLASMLYSLSQVKIILRAWGGEKSQVNCWFHSVYPNYMDMGAEEFLQRKLGHY